jgi:hypothetical protein
MRQLRRIQQSLGGSAKGCYDPTQEQLQLAKKQAETETLTVLEALTNPESEAAE